MKLIIFILVLFIPVAVFSQDLQFYKEDLTFTLNCNTFKVEGFYYFCNTGERSINYSIYYPFPKDSLSYGRIDSIYVLRDSKSVVFRKNQEDGIFIPLDLGSYQSSVYYITYSQQLTKNKAEYILQSTQKWGRPLERVSYRLVVPNNILIKRLSYQPDSTQRNTSNTVFYWSKSNFYPKQDFIIEFDYIK